MFQIGAGMAAAIVAGLVWGTGQAAGAFVGALAAALGTTGMARLALGGGIQPARVVYLRLWAGVLLKWLLVAVLLYLALAHWRLPPVATLSGLMLATLAFPLAHLSGTTKKTDTQGDK